LQKLKPEVEISNRKYNLTSIYARAVKNTRVTFGVEYTCEYSSIRGSPVICVRIHWKTTWQVDTVLTYEFIQRQLLFVVVFLATAVETTTGSAVNDALTTANCTSVLCSM